MGRARYFRYFESFEAFQCEMEGEKGREREREGRGEEREGGRKREDFIPLKPWATSSDLLPVNRNASKHAISPLRVNGAHWELASDDTQTGLFCFRSRI